MVQRPPLGLLAFPDLARLDGEVADEIRLYFTFVEGWSNFAPPPGEGEGRPVDLPDDRDDAIADWMKGREWRCRLSGLRVADFEKVADAIQELDHSNVTDEERNERRGRLNENLDGVSIPVMDMFLEAGIDDKSASAWRDTLHTSRWVTMILLRVEDVPTPALVVQLADPELLDREPLSTWVLLGLLVPPYDALRRLRDIFSLVHVPDAQDRSDDDEPPVDPGDPPSPAHAPPRDELRESLSIRGENRTVGIRRRPKKEIDRG